MRGILLRLIDPLRADAPMFAEQVDQIAGRYTVAVVGTDVIEPCASLVGILLCRNRQIDRQRLQHVLIGSGGVGIPYADFFSGFHGANTIGNDAVARKISAADDITGTGGRDGNVPVRKKTVDVTVRYQFGTGFGVRVRVEAVERLVLAVAPAPLVVLVDLVGRNVENAFDTRIPTHTLHEVDRPHDVRSIGAARVFVALADDGLRGKMQYDFGLRLRENGLQPFKVADVGDDAFHPVRQSRKVEQVWFCRRFQAVAGNCSSGIYEHPAKPCALESRMPGYKDALVSVERQLHS